MGKFTLGTDGISAPGRVLGPGITGQLQAQAKRVLARHHAAWLRGIADGSESPLFRDIEGADLDMPSLPAALRNLAEIVEPNWEFDRIRMRLTIPYPFSYLQWHWDSMGRAGTACKAIVYLNDVLPGAGEFCFVPGSHLVPARTLMRHSGAHFAESIGYRRYPGAAGSAVFFDVRGVHTAMPNTSRRPRVVLIVSYRRRSRLAP